jgi:hypothetical protein
MTCIYDKPLKERPAWLQKNGTYWYTSGTGPLRLCLWTDSRLDHNRLGLGCVFRTKKEAEREVRRTIRHRRAVAESLSTLLTESAKP